MRRIAGGVMVAAPAMTTIERRAARIVASRSKRAVDILFALVGLCVTAPVWVLAALAIVIDDGRPIWYRQARSGLRGRPFVVTKFRSMVVDADKDGAHQAVVGDRRITRAGRWLRATAADELPQLWNILAGDMSVVGPRALRPGEIEAEGPGVLVRLEDVPGFWVRSLVKPGLTGVAQIFAPRRLPRHQKFRYDKLYITRQNILVDAGLILQSIWVSLTGDWERRGRDARRHQQS